MRIRTQLLVLMIVLTGFISTANAATINFSIDSWDVAYGPSYVVYINLYELDEDGNGNGERAQLIFYRNNLPTNRVSYNSRFNLTTVRYSIEEFSNVYEMLKRTKIKSFHFSNDSGTNNAYVYIQH